MGFWDRLMGKRDGSSAIARERLLTVLVHDRVKLTPDMMESLKAELSAVIARYVDNVDPAAIEITLLHGDVADHLKAEIPLPRSRS